MLEEQFSLPAYINNNGDLFAHGEATAGFCCSSTDSWSRPAIPSATATCSGSRVQGWAAGSCGMASRCSEITRRAATHDCFAISSRRRSMRRKAHRSAACSGRTPRHVESRRLTRPNRGRSARSRRARRPGTRRPSARPSGGRMGEVAGDVSALALRLGGRLGGNRRRDRGRASAVPRRSGAGPRRLAPVSFNIEDPAQRERLLRSKVRTVAVTGSGPRICYDPMRDPPSESAALARARRWRWVRTRRRCGSWMWGRTPGLPGAACASSAREQARRPTLRSRS